MYEYFEELDQMNWSARGNVLNQYLRNTSIGTTVNRTFLWRLGTYLKTKIRPKMFRKTKNKYSRVYLDVHITAKPTDYCQNKGLLWLTLANYWDLIDTCMGNKR